MTVGVVLGPLMTLVVCNTVKPRKELRRGIAVLGLMQFAGLACGLLTVCIARAFHLAFEIDRFRVVHATAREKVLEAARPAGQSRFVIQAPAIDAVFAQAGRPAAGTAALSLAGRKSFWMVFVDPTTAAVAAFMPLGSF